MSRVFIGQGIRNKAYCVRVPANALNIIIMITLIRHVNSKPRYNDHLNHILKRQDCAVPWVNSFE